MLSNNGYYSHLHQMDNSPPNSYREITPRQPGNGQFFFTCSMCGSMFSDNHRLESHLMMCLRATKPQRVHQANISRTSSNDSPRSRHSREREVFRSNESSLTLSSHSTEDLTPRSAGKFRSFEWKFSSGRILDDKLAELYFGGASVNNSLVGGCGWWVVSRDLVIAYGGAPVIQNFPYLSKLKYEGLLNGLQAAYKKGIRRIIIRTSDRMILDHLLRGNVALIHFGIYQYMMKDIYVAIIRALKLFNYYSVDYAPNDENCPAVKLAKKSIADYYYNREVTIAKKCELSIPTQNHTNGIKSHESMKSVLLSDINLDESIKEFNSNLLSIKY